ncbi:MAG: hypothetical protein KF760_28840 [Candidatus Eremiobacteraeota bacterium]|nr:hypothetical protein [Candidatus Eremiobacteraeota bacterium]MCW5865905.1 hypothetical protein [Candidatus Eremiobacteraeota bacterium]
MKRFWFPSLMLAALACPVNAIPGQAAQALILPLETTGTYGSDDDVKLTKDLQARLQQLAPQAQIQVAQPSELSVTQYKTGQDRPPSAPEAEELARNYQTKLICWVDVNFNPSFQADTNTLAMAGAARFWVYNSELHRVTIDQPLSLVRTGVVRDVAAADASHALASELMHGCISDLGMQIFSIATQRANQNQQRVTTWAPDTAPPKPATSPNYSAMLKAVKDYQRAVRDQSYIDQSQLERNMYYMWVALNGDEQRQIEKDYPGIAQMMTAPPAYGGGYWPYYYPPVYHR